MKNNEKYGVDKVTNALSSKKGQFGFTVEIYTEPRMRKTNNPYVGRVAKSTIYTNAGLGMDYEKVVNARLVSEGKEPNFKATAPKGKKFFNDFFYVSEKDENTFYLKVGIRKNTNAASLYYVDGRLATSSEVEEIKSFCYESSSTIGTQSDAGLSDDNHYIINTPLFRNVRRISQGALNVVW